MNKIKSMIDLFRFVPWIKVVAITGGPCAGKSTFLKMAIHLLQKHGFKVIVVPEVARELISAGIVPWDPAWKNSAGFQSQVFQAILEKEARYFAALEAMELQGQKVVFLCDRGLADGMAYSGEAAFNAMLFEMQITLNMVIDRYAGVVHLVTAAEGAEEYYVTDDERHETPEEARQLDKKTLAAWQLHQHVSVVNNSTDFPQKINRALLALNRILAMPTPQEIEKKFLVLDFYPTQIPADAKSYKIWQIYLDRSDRPGIECRVRVKTTNDQRSYYYTEKTKTEIDGVRGEHEEQINEARYEELIAAYQYRDRVPIEKTRYKFCHQGYIFELDVYGGQLKGLVILEVELKSIDEMDRVVLPVNFDVVDVTSDKRYSNASLSRHGIPVR